MSVPKTVFNLARNYAKASLPVLLVLMIYVGWWINSTVTQQVIDNTAINTALYAESFIAPELQGLADRATLSPAEISHLEQLLSETPLGRKIRSLKIWSLTGGLLYHPQADLIGQQFPPTDSFLQAANGQTAAEFDEVGPGEEDFEEAKLDIALLEVYTPIKHLANGNIIAVAEFYQDASAMAERLEQTRLRAWLVVTLAMLVAYGLLYSIVWRGNNVIQYQDKTLREKLLQLRSLLQKNKTLSRKLQHAMNINTENNEKLLTRVSADLHDGPAQYIGFALLRLDALSESGDGANRAVVEELRKALNDSLLELRNISKGLALPDLEHMSVQTIVSSAVKAHRHRTGSEVEIDITLPESTPAPDMPVKIAVYRSIQEGLNNAYRHAGASGQRVLVQVDEKQLMLVVADQGPGFDYNSQASNGSGLGLNGLRERIRGLGGRFNVESQRGAGTLLRIRLPLLGED